MQLWVFITVILKDLLILSLCLIKVVASDYSVNYLGDKIVDAINCG